MLKQISSLGTVLNRNEQKLINGGKLDPNPPEYCGCYNIIWGVQGPIIPSLPDGPQGLIQSYEYSDGAIAVGFSAIIPTPACCE